MIKTQQIEHPQKKVADLLLSGTNLIVGYSTEENSVILSVEGLPELIYFSPAETRLLVQALKVAEEETVTRL